jgi:7,8-dihydropterin-6-yl-methyl-4-(beta-D-ribofuranosyl)aminobenzene 5'-phosphate synthase
MGGWHLAPAPDGVVANTVDALKQINPDYLIPMHCTGLNTIGAIQREMPDTLIMDHAVDRHTGGIRRIARSPQHRQAPGSAAILAA